MTDLFSELASCWAKLLSLVANLTAAMINIWERLSSGEQAAISIGVLACLALLVRWRSRSRRRAADPDRRQQPPERAISLFLVDVRQVLLVVGIITAFLNVLYLTGSFFMLQVYDRVVPSRSISTLVALCLFALLLYAFQAALDILRGRILIRTSRWLDDVLTDQTFHMITRAPLKVRQIGDGLEALRDLDQIRSFLSGLGPTALFDLPWIPFYLVICWLFHPAIGITAAAGAVVLIGLAVATELKTKTLALSASTHLAVRNAVAESGRRNAEIVQALGMRDRITARWSAANAKYMDSRQRSAELASGLGSASKVMRLILQSGVLALGAYLVVQQEATGGIIIAASILTSRALAPVELAIANWKNFTAARQGWGRLRSLLRHFPPEAKRTELPSPRILLSVEGVSVAPPGEQRAVVQDASFILRAGQGLGVVGASASGKSSLVRAIVGVWSPIRGTVRLDGAALGHWPSSQLGRHIGYLPQDVELFAGTVAENIARFETEPDSEALLSAAKAAGVHELVLRLPEGYETQIGEGGSVLSAGQRQRIALARALYRDPFLVVLDEPNSNLDADGDKALTQALLGVRARGGIIIIVAHRSSAVAGVDHLLVMSDGRMQMVGPKDEVMSKLNPAQPTPIPLKVVDGAHA